ncbi:TIGR04282 family arsenosugar biosynthesis glycosyltransferase [Congregibacter variabilis]|uniref:TIGR04282 family arsenosugar biosynthesis glycosyltransferase n=1 Tax=Congregibacter variabilis TaxID=3081200 RepID=A0ABZ0I5K5_9GAMM|nr:TIGR04282 family arsenosugar biosynthesis glycosyltransferase [Congregibacter sp. IMCC43200]
MSDTRLLQQFARYPEPGKVKTRLQTALTARDACAVHEELLLHTANTLVACGFGPAELWLDRLDEHLTLSAALSLGMSGVYLQQGADLGERMYAALAQGLTRAQAVVLVGSDCPVLSRDYLAAAFKALESTQVVLGPAEDGGFVLIACTSVREGMFDDISWGGAQVLDETQQRLKKANLSHALLDVLYDIDTPADLQRWRNDQGSGVGSDSCVLN